MNVGQTLKATRLEKGFEIAFVAQSLRLNDAYIVALESEDWDALPEETFIKGYIRSYAKYLSLDEGALVTAYVDAVKTDTEAQEQKAADEKKQKMREGVKPQALLAQFLELLGEPKGKIIAGFCVALLVLAVLPLVFSSDGSEPDESIAGSDAAFSKQAENATTSTEQSLQNEQATAANAPEIENAFVEDAVVEVDTASNVLLEPGNEQLSLEKESQAANKALRVKFNEDCWFELVVGSEVVASRLAKAGELVEHELAEPGVLKLGNAQVAEVSYAGDLIDTQGRKVRHIELN